MVGGWGGCSRLRVPVGDFASGDRKHEILLWCLVPFQTHALEERTLHPTSYPSL